MLLKAIAPYTRVKLPYLASELNGIPLGDVEDLLVSLILDGKVDGKIDQVKTRLGLGSRWQVRLRLSWRSSEHVYILGRCFHGITRKYFQVAGHFFSGALTIAEYFERELLLKSSTSLR